MSTAPTIDAVAERAHPSGSRAHRSVFLNLLFKELRESRGAVIAGLAIFWVMPAFLEFAYALVDPDRELMYGFAWILLLAAGWLYAIVVGAHTVCRDWGKDEEQFLLAQPVSPWGVVAAKLIAGALTVAVVVGIAGAWDAFEWRLLASYDPGAERIYRSIAAAAIGPVGVMYLFAFAGGFLTRQTLTSVLLACLAALMWAVAPLLSTSLAWLQPNWVKWSEQGQGIGATFIVVLVVAAVGCVVVALITSRRERVIRLGHKPLAWTVALVVLVLFGMAYTEVGNALTVVSEATILLAEGQVTVGRIQVAWRDETVYAVVAPPYHAAIPTPKALPVTRFRIGRDGRIADAGRDELPVPAQLRDRTGWNKPRFSEVMTAGADQAGHLLIMGIAGRQTRDEKGRSVYHLERFWRAQYAWPEGEAPELVSLSELPSPSDRLLCSWALSSRYLYVIRLVSSPRQAEGNGKHEPFGDDSIELAVFDWSKPVGDEPRYRFDLPRRVNRILVSDGKVSLWDEAWINLVTFDADHPDMLTKLGPKLKKWGRTLADSEAIARYASAFGIVGRNVTITTDGDLTYVRDVSGLKVLRWDASPEVEDFVLVGECRCSPLTGLSRMDEVYPIWPRLIGHTLYVEMDRMLGPVVNLFNVADAAHPKRVGFYYDQRSGAMGERWRTYIENVATTERYLAMIRPVVAWEEPQRKTAGLIVTVVDKPHSIRHP